MKLSSLIATMLFLSVLASCSYLQKLTCNSDNARKSGEADASKGLANKPGLQSAKSCDGAEYTAASFEADYTFGFNQKRAQVCTPAEAAKYGKEDGTNADTAKKQLQKLQFCNGVNTFAKINESYNTEWMKAFCSEERATKLGAAEGTKMSAETFDTAFNSCSAKSLKTLKMSYTKSYGEALKAAKKKQVDDFIASTSTANFNVAAAPMTALCKINADKSAATVEVANKATSEVLLKGDWKFQYFNGNFEKITEDNFREALLVNGNNKKQFSKMTLPKNADFCRAEFVTPDAVPTIVK